MCFGGFSSVSVCEFGVCTLYFFNSAHALHSALMKTVHGKNVLGH